MSDDYSNYRPLLLDDVSIDRFKSDEYRDFICAAAITPGIRLLLRRHSAKPDWPYVDTKFNPNSGRDLPETSYQVVFAWFLGRGAEALDGHLGWIDRLEDLSADEKHQAAELFPRLIANMSSAIAQAADKNNGRCPFRVNLDLEAIDEQGRRIDVDTTTTGAGDIFCGKGLIADGSPDRVRRGLDMLLHSAALISQNRVATEQFKDQPKDIGQGSKMLMQAAAPLLCRKTDDPRSRAQMLEVVADFMATVLDRHYHADTAVFSEYIDAQTHQRKTYLDPGHANEFVGLGLGAVESLKANTATLTDQRKSLIETACREMPRLLIKSCQLGWNTTHRGLHKAVDTRSGNVLNDDMPWWNLPETMRAAVRAYEVAGDEQTRRQCLSLLRDCHNAYFEKYLNRDNMLFPVQTISGATGKVVDKVPAVPEGDPLYHTNLALLEMLDVLERL